MDRYFDNPEEMIAFLVWWQAANHIAIDPEEGGLYVLQQVVGDYWQDILCDEPEKIIERLVQIWREEQDKAIDVLDAEGE